MVVAADTSQAPELLSGVASNGRGTPVGNGFMRAGEDPGGTEATHAANANARNDAWARWKTLLSR